MTLIQFYQHTGVSTAPIWRLFGSWRKLRDAAGLPESGRMGPIEKITTEEILNELKRRVEEKGDVTKYAFCREIAISPTLMSRRGTWKELREAVNLPSQGRTGRSTWQLELLADIPELPEVPELPELFPPDESLWWQRSSKNVEDAAANSIAGTDNPVLRRTGSHPMSSIAGEKTQDKADSRQWELQRAADYARLIAEINARKARRAREEGCG